jgi:hypothetical protein
MPLAPTVELIESQAIVEGREYEFKQQVDFDQAQQKSNFIDDVVAFLNSEISGHIVIGVKEKGGAFAGYSPLLADPDHLCRRVTSIIQDGVEPRPLGVDVRAIAILGGSILDVAIAQHRAGPYQNRANGAFYVRTGAKNTPLRRDELAAYFVTRERYEADLGTRLAREQADLDASGTMAAPGAVLDIAILPREHYDRDRPPFERGQGILKGAPAFHWDRRQPFQGCERGHQAIEHDGHQKGRWLADLGRCARIKQDQARPNDRYCGPKRRQPSSTGPRSPAMDSRPGGRIRRARHPRLSGLSLQLH